MTNKFNFQELRKKQKEIEKEILIGIENTINCLKTNDVSDFIDTNVPEDILIEYIKRMFYGNNKSSYITLSYEGIQAIIDSSYKELRKFSFTKEIEKIPSFNNTNSISKIDLVKINNMILHCDKTDKINNLINSFLGKYKLNKKEHLNILNHISKNSISLLSSICTNSIFSKENKEEHNINIDELLNSEIVQKEIKQLTESDKIFIFTQSMIDAISNGNKENYYYFKEKSLEHNIDLNEVFSKKKDLNDIILIGHKHSCFYNILEDILKYIPYDVHEHFILRTALSVGHDKTVQFIFSYFSDEDILKVKPIYQSVLGNDFNLPEDKVGNNKRYRYLNYKQNYNSFYKILLNNIELNELLPKKSLNSPKVKL